MKYLLKLILIFITISHLQAQDFFEHIVTEKNKSGTHMTKLSHKLIDGNPDALLFVTQNYEKQNANEIGVWYNNKQWYIFNQNLKSLQVGTRFFVFVPPKNDTKAFSISTNTTNTSGHICTIKPPKGEINKDAIVFVTQQYGKYNTSSIGVWYNEGNWKIYNENRNKIPLDTKFNILILEDGNNKLGTMMLTAGKHIIEENNSHFSSINPKIKAKQAKLIFTSNWAGTYNTNTIGAWYNENQWNIINQGENKIPKGVQVNYFKSIPQNAIAVENPIINSDIITQEKPLIDVILPTVDEEEINISNLPTIQTFKKTVKLPLHTIPQEVTYHLDNEGMAIFEGDIVLGEGHNFVIEEPEPLPVPRSFSEYGEIGAEKYGKQTAALVIRQSDGIINRNWLWPNGVIPYHIRLNFSEAEKNVIRDAIDELNSRTNLNIFPTTLIMEKNIEFVKRDLILGGAQGSSRVGRNRTSRHRIRLKEGFTKGTVIHELLHAAGMWHEQSRRDRDRYVEVKFENIDNSYEHNFDIHDTDAEIITPYDLNSIMHYSGWAFSRNGSPTIINRSTGDPVWQTSELSAYDIDGINTVYPVDYYGDFSRAPTSLRTVSITVKRIISRDLDGPGDENEFWIKSEIGPDFQWRPGNSSNPTRRQSSGKRRTSNLEVSPEWKHSHLIEAGEQYAKIWLLLREDDGLASNERKDDTFNINPFPAIDHIELKVDTYSGRIYLGNVDGVFLEENYIGDVGDIINLEGFEGKFKAYIEFQILIDDPLD